MNYIKVFIYRIVLITTCIIYSGVINASDFEVDGICYNKIPDAINEVEVTANNGANRYSGDVTIPSEITYSGDKYVVTAIGDRAFNGCAYNLKSLVLPNTIVSIGESAFYGLANIESFTIPASVTNIGNRAFGECHLESIVIPDKVTSIGQGAFWRCPELKTVTLGKSVKDIGGLAFSQCGVLESINIPNSVESIGHEAFRSCTNLLSIEIPNSVISIGKSAFRECTSLKSATLSHCLSVSHQ